MAQIYLTFAVLSLVGRVQRSSGIPITIGSLYMRREIKILSVEIIFFAVKSQYLTCDEKEARAMFFWITIY